MFDGAVDRQMFNAFVEKMLAPILKPGDILVLDNLGTHKSKTAQEFVESRYADYKFLPAYSPDLNPIEKNVEQNEADIARTKSQNTIRIVHRCW